MSRNTAPTSMSHIVKEGSAAHVERSFSSAALALVWFGASVSLAEILTGTFFAPLGFAKGTAAILIGHLIGGMLFWLVSLASARNGASAMETAGRAFGVLGRIGFSSANVVQLVGWTAIMIASGATAAAFLAPTLGTGGWSLVIGALIIVWIAIGSERMAKLQSAAALLLFVLTIVASVTVFSQETGTLPANDPITFGAAVELAVAMPLSWLPVAGDYTRKAKAPFAGTASATIAYTVGSCWMFFIGMGLALFAGSSDLAEVLSHAGLGLAGILVVVFSTVTTTFLDAQSAGISANAIARAVPAKAAGVAAALLGCALAIFAPVANFEGFLYLIGSVFAPMAAIVCVDSLAFDGDSSSKVANVPNLILWIAGFALYRVSLGWALPCGNTLPVIMIIALATYIVQKSIHRRP